MSQFPRYSIVTWPESQPFVGNPDCILICPPETDIDPTALDSAYLVPEKITGPIPTHEAYLRIPHPESQKWDEMEKTGDNPDAVLHDYETQNAYVREDIYLESLEN